MTDSHNAKFSLVLAMLAVILLGYFLLLPGLFSSGIQADEGVHLTVARELSRGAVLYRDLFENRTPGAEWLLSIFVRFGAAPLETARLLTVGATLISTSLIFSAARLMGASRFLALLVALLFLLSPLNLFWTRFFLLEPFVTAASLGSASILLCGLKGNENETVFQISRTWLMAGFWMGIAILFKQTALVTATAFTTTIFLLFVFNWSTLARLGATLLAWFGGLLLPLLMAGFVLGARGGLGDFFNFLSGADRLAPFENLLEKLAVFGGWVSGQPLIMLALICTLLTLINWFRDRRAVYVLFPAIWFGAESTALFLPEALDLSWGGGSHYILPALAAGSLVAASGSTLFAPLFGERRRLAQATLLVTLLLCSVTVLGWGRDLRFILQESDYPKTTRAQEKLIGNALASYAPSGETLILGNAGFYHWADSTPKARFFHYPSFLGSSELDDTVADELLPLIRREDDSPLEGLLVSRMHLDFRLPDRYVNEIWSQWEPVNLFEYPYQQDMLLFVPRIQLEPVALSYINFENQITLKGLSIQTPVQDQLLVHLIWTIPEATETPYTAFVHLVGADGSLIGQHDGQPGSGFRPTPSWRADELISDYHWIGLPAGTDLADVSLAIGMYNSMNGVRLSQMDDPSVDTFIHPATPTD